MTTTPRQHPLLCQCGTCKTPFAVVQNGCLVITVRHNGDKHTNVLRLEDVKQMLEQMAAAVYDERMADVEAYDAAAAKLQAALTAAFPDCKWWVPTSFDMIRWEFTDWGNMITQGRLEVQVKRAGYGARVPCTVALAEDDAAVQNIGEIAIYTMDRYRDENTPPPEGWRTLHE